MENKMKTFKKFLEEYIYEDDAWWTSKSKEFQDQYIKEHPNSKYAKNTKSQKLLNKQPLKPEKAEKPEKTDEKLHDGTYFLKGFNGDKEVLEIELDSKTYQAAKKEAMMEMNNYIVDDEEDEDDYVNDDDVELWELHYIKTDKDGHVDDEVLGKY